MTGPNISLCVGESSSRRRLGPTRITTRPARRLKAVIFATRRALADSLDDLVEARYQRSSLVLHGAGNAAGSTVERPACHRLRNLLSRRWPAATGRDEPPARDEV